MANFPDLNTKKKDKDWHKKYVQAIMSRTVNSGYDGMNASMTLLYDYFNGTQTGDEYSFLQESEDGDTLPAKWINYNKIRTKINLLIGEMDEKGFEIVAKTINTESKSRKQEEKRALLTQVRLNKDLMDLEADMGLPIAEEGLPEDEQEVEDFFEYEYKDIYEVIMSQAIKYCANIYKLRHLRLDLFRDITVVGRCFVKSEVIGDVPHVRRVDPRNMIFDESCEDPYMRDATYFGEIRYMSIADAAQQYNLDKAEIEAAHNAGKDAHGLPKTVGTSSAQPFKQENGETKVMVFTGVWQDTKAFNHKESVDKHGGEHLKFVGEEEKVRKDEKIHKKNIKIWRKGTIIGGDIFVEWGEHENMVRAIDNIADTPAPYFGVLMNWVNNKTVSITEQLSGLQDLKNIAMYNIQLAMARAGAKGFIYDVSQIPEDWEVEDVMRYLKTAGIAFIDSRKDGTPAQYNQFGQIDLSLSSSVQYYIEISRMVDAEMDTVSGINEAREGTIQYASQAVGVTQSSLMQSNLKTKVLYTYFDGFMDDVLNHQAGLVKIAWENKEVFAPIIGDVGVDFLAQEVDVDLQDYALFIEYVPTILRDKETLQNWILAAMQNGEISFVEAMKIIREKDTMMAIRKMEKAVMKKTLQAQAQEQAQMQAQMEQQQQMEMSRQAQEQAKYGVDMDMKAFDRDTQFGLKKMDLLRK